VNLGPTVNTTLVEQNAYLSSDNETLLFSSDRPGGFGGLDLYMSTRTKLRGQSAKWRIKVVDANPADSRHMIEGFVNSIEYRHRFGL